MTPGTHVRMTAACRRHLLGGPAPDHIREFGNCIGVVEGLVDWGTCQGPEVNVRWQPSGLRYAYDPSDLEIVS